MCDGGRIARRVVLASNFCRGNDAAGQVQNLWWTFATKHGRAEEEEDCQLLPPTAPRVPTRNPSKNQAFLLSSWRFPPWFSQWFQVCLSLTERFSTLSGQKMWSLETINQKFWCGNSSSNSLKILAFSGDWYLNKFLVEKNTYLHSPGRSQYPCSLWHPGAHTAEIGKGK